MSADVHSLVGAYAVDAIDEQERVAFERHLAECPECTDEVSSLRAAASSLSLVSEVTPPASMRAAVLAGIRTVRPLPPLEQSGEARTVATLTPGGPAGTPVGGMPVVTDDGGAEPAPRAKPEVLPTNVIPMRRRRPVAEWLVGAAAAVALIAGGIAWSPWDNGQGTQISASERVLEASDAQRVVQTIDGARVTIVRSPSMGRAVIIADNMPAAPDGKDYQVWFNQPNKGMVSAGVMPHGTASTVSVMLDGDARSALAAGITLEPAGGSTEPTSAPLALFAFS